MQILSTCIPIPRILKHRHSCTYTTEPYRHFRYSPVGFELKNIFIKLLHDHSDKLNIRLFLSRSGICV